MTGKTATENQRAVRPAQQQTGDDSQMLFTSIKRRKVHQDVAEQIENHLPQTFTRPIPLENPPREILLPEPPPSPDTGDGEEALDDGGDQ